MGFLTGRFYISPLLILCVYLTFSTYAKSHHVRHHRDRFKRQQGAHLYLPGTFVTDNEEREGGPWLDWSSPSPCTRTCGGGVSAQERQCTSGYSCKGPSERHFSCNTQDCPDLADFRSQQCSEYDAVPFEDVYYQWVPYTKSPQVCELNCMPRGERFYYRHKLQVIDGTRCDDEKLDVCVDGKCQPVGCDMMLGSNAKEDTCRVCGGDDSTCNTMTGLLDMQDLQVGYNDVLLIPAGAVNIRVKEIAPSNNYLAVRNTTGYYYLNGNWRIDFPRSIDFAGCKFHYDRYPQGFPAPDSVTCLGPIEEALFVVLLYQDVNVGIEYEYSTPKTVHHSAETETYAWTFDQFTSCSASCGGGYQQRNVTCAGRKSLEEASSNLCDVNNKPVESQRCGETPCDPKWVAKEWEKCSEPCGDNGTQTRKVYCEQIISGGVPSIVDDQQCANIQKPPSQQPCNQGVVCAEWHTGPWKPCDKLCDHGKETRKVTCYRKEKGKIIALEDSDCSHVERPETEKKCLLRPCEGVDWVASEWSGCKDKCGLSEETRRVRCATATGDVYDDKLCEETEIKPPTSRKCEQTAENCDFGWQASQWSDCSAKCGSGIQTRRVFCVQETEDAFKKVDPSNCDQEKKYEESKNCTAKETVCSGEWFTGPWTECSQQCGGGVKSRKVICMHGEKVVTIKDCDKDATPFSTEECNKEACDKEQSSSVSLTTKASVPESPAELTTLPDKEQSKESDVETLDEDYELVDDAICEGGEFVIVDDKDKYVAFGTAVEYHKETKETTLSLDDLMLSDSTYVSGYSSLSPDYGSGDFEFGKTTGDDLGSTAFDTSIWEGSGDDTTYFKSSEGLSTGTTEIEGSGSSPMEVTEPLFVTKTAYTLGKEITTIEPEEVSEISTAKETILGRTDDIQMTPDGTTEVSTASEPLISETTKGEITTSEGDSEDATKLTMTTGAVTTMKESTEIATDKSSIDETATDKLPTDQTSTDESATDNALTEQTSVDKTSTDKLTDATSIKESTAEETTLSTIKEPSETTESSTEVSQTTPIESTETTSTPEFSETTIDSSATTEGGVDKTTGALDTTTLDTVKVDMTTVETATKEIEETRTTEKGEEPIAEAEPDDITETESDGITEATVTKTESEATAVTGSTETIVSTELSIDKSTIAASESTTLEEMATTIAKEVDTTLEATTPRFESAATDGVTTDKITTAESVTATTEAATVLPEGVTTVSMGTEISIVSSEGAIDVTTIKMMTTEESTESAPTVAEVGKSTTDIDVGVTTEDLQQVSVTTGIPIIATTTKVPRTPKPDIGDLFPKKPKQKMCKRKKNVLCKETEFGCCSDKITPANGPFNQGCPSPKTCNETKYGCCEDGVSPADGKNFKGCPESQCKETLFGCCLDNKTPAEGNDNEGCPPLCASSEFGCCSDNVTEATGPNKKGCPEEKEEEKEVLSSTTESVSTTGTTEEYIVDCNVSKYGCCPDGVTAAEGNYFEGCDIVQENCNDSLYGCCPDGVSSARGPNYKECDTECSRSPFGCCPDGITPAHGYLREGCCLSSRYGCCPDNIKEAEGPKLQGCGCQYSPYGCCPDNATSARGHDKEGCGCLYTPNGCCADNYTPAAGVNFTGCPCRAFQFGCCPDGVTVAQGPHQQGCGCRNTEFGCCSDEQTPAEGSNFEGCDCASSKFGCCLDGFAEAQGENFDGCRDIPENLQASCSQEKEKGPCRNYTVKWFYDMQYGGCSRFWYGGCEGTTNRFKDKNECNAVCVEPQGKDRCKLPMVAGPCEGYYPQWYYDKEHNHCAQFIYGGCLGNNNKFETVEECNNLCVKERNIDACEQPMEEGPCRGNFYRWYFNKEEGACQPFRYGGCEGNNNNFHTELSCKQKCAQEGRKKVKDMCHLPAELGECSDYRERWYYDTAKKECRRFYYGGCGGNKNNFETEESCLSRCSPEAQTEVSEPPEPPELPVTTDTSPQPPEEPFKTEFCFLPYETGPCRKSEARWYYDKDGACKHFLYGGCQGNRNNFKTAEECNKMCGSAQDRCSLPKLVGPCNAAYHQWYYNQSTDTCEQFVYGGCMGNKNRFDDQVSCEHQCRKGPPTVTQSPEESNVPHIEDPTNICYKPIDTGNCTDNIPAYYYDPKTQRCVAFVYTGCGGNANRYTSEEQCERQCGSFRGQDVCSLPKDEGPCSTYHLKYYFDTAMRQCAQFYYGGCEGNGNRFSTAEECQSICVSREETKPERPSSADTQHSTTEPTSMENPCQVYNDLCKKMNCPYGIKAYVDDTQCNRCKCDDPCEDVTCPEGTQCGVDVNLERGNGNDANFVGVCRETNKTGECPVLIQSADNCERECHNDADCTSTMKCCSNGCGTECVRPSITTVTPPAELRTPSYLPSFTDFPAHYYPPQVIEEEFQPEVTAGEGDYVMLRCAISGNPNPTFSWKKDNLLIDGKEPRYRLTLDGSALQIISLYKTDSGIYLCTADNKIGQPLTKEIKLVVQVPVRANITLKDTKYPLKSDVHIPCDVDGYPLPQVQWYKDGQPIYPNDRIQITANYRLIIRDTTETDSGEYRCEARNEYSVATSTTPLLIRGRQIHPNCTDNAFFANCKLIVDGKFCNHPYYAKFCCRSCTEAGQLDAQGPHLNDQPATIIESNLV